MDINSTVGNAIFGRTVRLLDGPSVARYSSLPDVLFSTNLIFLRASDIGADGGNDELTGDDLSTDSDRLRTDPVHDPLTLGRRPAVSPTLGALAERDADSTSKDLSGVVCLLP